jgi:putative component of toxin-antitoxin plasmid stabilization module
MQVGLQTQGAVRRSAFLRLRRKRLIILLAGGPKSSQSVDIVKAKAAAAE